MFKLFTSAPNKCLKIFDSTKMIVRCNTNLQISPDLDSSRDFTRQNFNFNMDHARKRVTYLKLPHNHIKNVCHTLDVSNYIL